MRRRFFLFSLSVLACGTPSNTIDSGQIDTPIDAGHTLTDADCAGLDASACSARGCRTFNARHFVDGGAVSFDYAGCAGAGGGCGTAFSCGTDQQGACWLFNEYCQPPGYEWRGCDQVECPSF